MQVGIHAKREFNGFRVPMVEVCLRMMHVLSLLMMSFQTNAEHVTQLTVGEVSFKYY